MEPHNTDITAFIQQQKLLVEEFLTRLLPLKTSHSLYAAMQYSVLNNGKRMRPVLVYATGKALGLNIDSLNAAAAAVELIHCYSLVHDDLPAMDDDDLRRGLPTCHKVFGEATAILVGDALQTLAFEVLADSELNPVTAQQQMRMVKILARAAGCSGMILGQAEDMAAEHKQLSLHELTHLHNCKTGALFNACVELALVVSGKDSDHAIRESLLDYARNLGLAFQIRDDILDVTGSTSEIGKKAGSDQEAGKATFPSLLGLEEANQHAKAALQRSLLALEPLETKGIILRALAEHLIERRY